jgi:hypothetical protein
LAESIRSVPLSPALRFIAPFFPEGVKSALRQSPFRAMDMPTETAFFGDILIVMSYRRQSNRRKTDRKSRISTLPVGSSSFELPIGKRKEKKGVEHALAGVLGLER